MSDKSIIIIGGGIAGLAAGCYGQMNGFRTRIFEMHKKNRAGSAWPGSAMATLRTAASTGSWDIGPAIEILSHLGRDRRSTGQAVRVL